MAGFEYRGQLNGADNPILENLIIGNSVTVTVGDAVLMTTGFVALGTSSSAGIYGIVVGLVTDKGIDLNNPHVTYSGTYTDSSATYVAANDNQTVDKVRAVVCADPMALWYNDSSGTLTTAMLKQHFKLTDEDQIDQGTNSATVGQFQLWKLDPDADSDASKGLWRISLPQGLAFEPET